MTAADRSDPTTTERRPDAVIAATKLHIPATRPGLVARGALVRTLHEGSSRRLTLLDAPAGFGKTTLLAEWHASVAGSTPFAWLSLDEGDNDPVRFWSGVIESLRTVRPGVGSAAEAGLGNRGVPLEQTVLPLLVNELAELRSRLVLALDDYHLVSDEQVHESLAFLIDHLPRVVHVAIATRSDPPLPIGRLRTAGELTEIRSAELRLTEDEAAGLLSGALGRSLAEREVARLQERTEGWPAGLYLAALSLRGRSDARDFIESFAGDDRHIVDYLLGEVLAGLPGDLREFLLRTSVLDRMCGPLCEAVTGEGGAARTLERIERENLFLVPLDTTRSWYRYHHLFGDLLEHELGRSSPELIPELHRRAGAWHRASGSVPEAIHHAAAAGQPDEARELIAGHWNDYFNQGRLETVAGWLAALPEAVVRSDARLCVAGAWLAMDRGRLDEAGRWIAAAQAAVESAERGDGAGDAMSDTAMLRAVHCFKAGNLAEAERAARNVLELDPGDASFARTVAHLMLGASRYWRGHLESAAGELDRASALARADGNDLGLSYALGYLAMVRVDAGSPAEAEELAAKATGVSENPGFVEHFVPMIGHLARGLADERRGRLRAAEQPIRRAVELSARGAGRLEVAGSLLALARIRQALGDRDAARGLLRRAREALDGSSDSGTLGAAVAIAERGAGTHGRDRADGGGELTDRELAVLRLLNSELSQREIGEALYVSENTVKTHTKGIYRKLDASNRTEALARARELAML